MWLKDQRIKPHYHQYGFESIIYNFSSVIYIFYMIYKLLYKNMKFILYALKIMIATSHKLKKNKPNFGN